MKKHALLFALFVGCIVLSGAAIIGYQDIAVITTPGNPASGYDRLYVTSGGGLSCLTSAGANCIPTGAASPLTTKGDLYTFGTANTRLAVGTNGQVLYANSGATNGIDYEAPISLTTTGTSGASTFTPGNPNVLNIPQYSGTTTTIANGTATLTSSAISSAACSSATTVSATGVATTDAIIATVNADPTATTGYVPLTAGSLYIWPYPTSNNVNFKVCNNTSSSVTPTAITLNWRVVR